MVIALDDVTACIDLGFPFNPLLQSLSTDNSGDNPMCEFESIMIEDGGSKELECFGIGPVDAEFVVGGESTKSGMLWLKFGDIDLDFTLLFEAAFLNSSNMSIDELIRVRASYSTLFNPGTALKAIVTVVVRNAVDTV